MPNRTRKRHLLGYIRVSSVGLRTGDSFRSPEDQARAIRTWAEANGDRVTMLPPELDESGGKVDRPILQDALRQIEGGQADGIVVAYGSRLMRNVRGALELYDRLDAAGGVAIDVALDIDTSTPEGRMIRTQLAAISEYELDRYKVAFDARKRDATERGIWSVRQVPRGYDKDPTTRHLVPNGDAPLVRRAFEGRAAGRRIIDLAAMLGMTAQGTRLLLRNRVYLGELRHGQHFNPAAHPAIVSEDLFDRVQAEYPRPMRSKRRTAKNPFAGLVRCSACGFVMVRNSGKGTPSGASRDFAYSCTRLFSGGRCPSPASIMAHRLEDYLDAVIVRTLTGIEAVGFANDREIDGLAEELMQAERELAAFVDVTEAVSIDAATFGRGIQSRQERVDDARARLTTAKRQRGAAEVVLQGPEVYLQADPAAKNAIARALFEAVAVSSVGTGRVVPVVDRVAIFPTGSNLTLPRRRGNQRSGPHPIPLDHPKALRPRVDS